MLTRNRSLIAPVILLALLAIPLLAVYAADGVIEGKITDPKGAAISGATVTVTDETNNQIATALSDAKGQYKIAGLAPGDYTVVVSASGFSEARKETVKVDFGKGWTKLGMATMIGNTSIDVSDIKLPTTPKRVAICALNDVLAANVQNGK